MFQIQTWISKLFIIFCKIWGWKKKRNFNHPIFIWHGFYVESWAPTCGAVQEGAQQLDLRLQLGQPEVDGLVVENRLLEDLPLPRVLDGLLDDDVHRGQNWRDRHVTSTSALCTIWLAWHAGWNVSQIVGFISHMGTWEPFLKRGRPFRIKHGRWLDEPSVF